MRKRATPSRRRKFNWGKKEEDIYREGQPFKSAAEHNAQRISSKVKESSVPSWCTHNIAENSERFCGTTLHLQRKIFFLVLKINLSSSSVAQWSRCRATEQTSEAREVREGGREREPC